MATLYEKYESGSTEFKIYGSRQVSQSFKAESDHNVARVDLYLKKYGSPGDLTIEIYAADDDDKPTGPLLTSGTTSAGDIPTSEDWVSTNVTRYLLTSGNKYVIVAIPDGGGSLNSIVIIYDSSGSYADGKLGYSMDAGSSWTVVSSWDERFRIYDVPPPPAPPAAEINPDAFTGYHCFQEQFQKRRGEGKIPYKTPDGTLYRDAPSG